MAKPALLCMHLLQWWCGLADEPLADVIFDSQALRTIQCSGPFGVTAATAARREGRCDWVLLA
jgi:hypothetical protein